MLLGITTEGKIGLGVLAGIFIVFALLASFWFPRRNPDFPGNRLGLFTLVTVVLFVSTLAGVVVFAKEDEEAPGGEAAAETHAGETTETGGEEAPAGDAAAGKAVFAENGCGDCHTLEAAGSSGAIGPNLDESQPDAALVEERVRDGAGAMPAFEGRLTDEQIADVTAYVVESTSS